MNKFHIVIIIAIGIFLLIYTGNTYMNFTFYSKVNEKMENLDIHIVEINKGIKSIDKNTYGVNSNLDGPVRVRGDIDATISY